MRDHSLPEILRVSLSSVILTLKSMGIRNVIGFDYIEVPDTQAIVKALGDLSLLGAIDQEGNLTKLGKEMSRFPLDPHYSKALFIGAAMGIE